MIVLYIVPEPRLKAEVDPTPGAYVWDAPRVWLATAVIGPFKDFTLRPMWPAILLFVFGYKIGEAMAGVLAMPLYISLGFSLSGLATIWKLVGFFPTAVGPSIGGCRVPGPWAGSAEARVVP